MEPVSTTNGGWIEISHRLQLAKKLSLRYIYVGKERPVIEHHGLDSETYALCGGGFPIRVNNFEGIVGVILASHLHPVADHGFIVDCLKAYLQKPDVPGIEM
ncbi:MAG: heme-binding protein [Oscillospiraceae bacterium]